jgi:PAS domain S-box-containing protein
VTRKYLIIQLLLIALLTVPLTTKPASNVGDSIVNALKKNKGNRGELLYQLAFYYYQQNDSNALQYINQSIRAIDSLKDDILRNNVYLLKSKQLNKEKRYYEAIQTLNTIRAKVRDPYVQSQLMLIQAESYYEIREYQESKKSLLAAIPLIEENNTVDDLYTARKLLAQNYLSLEEYSNALKTLYELHAIAKSLNNMFYLGSCYTYFGLVSEGMDEFYEALRYYQLAIDYLQEFQYSDLHIECINHIGNIYYQQEQYFSANEYYEEALEYITPNTSPSLRAQNLFNLAKSQLKLEKSENSDRMIDSVLSTCRSFNLDHIESEVYNYLGELSLDKGNYSEALHYLNRSVQLSHYNESIENTAYPLLLYAKSYFLIKKYDDAIAYNNIALDHCLKNKNFDRCFQCYLLLSDIYKARYDYENAIKFQSLAMEYKDSAFNQINNREIKYLQAKFESKKKQNVIDELQQEKLAQEQSLKLSAKNLEKQKAYLSLILLALAFIVILSFILAIWLNQKRKANNLLEQRNYAIAQQKEEIEAQKQHLQEINGKLEKLSIIVRETDNAVKLMNAKGEVIWINEGYTKLYGYCLNDLKNSSIQSLVGSESNVDVNQLVNVWFGNKTPITFESLNETKNGGKVWAQTTLTPILDKKGKITSMIAIDSDISAIKNAEEKIISINREMTSSISYAKRIQEAMITPFSFLTNHFPNSFKFYKPKSIVSGDFYWFAHQHDRLIIACADCTGHGVPGAFMSLIGISFLNKIVNEKGFVTPSIILNRLRMNIINHLNQGANRNNSAGDGMDMSLISIDKKNNQLEYAGAMNPVYIIRGEDFIELKPDRMPVGFFDNEDRPFSTTTISLKKGDQIFMFSDGYYDQFGGEKGSKMKAHRFKAILKETKGMSIKEKQDFIEKRFYEWKGDTPQIDDILVMNINYE